MIECPRCGFAQPKDQYCASCGLNIDQFLARPKSIWLKLLQNPNLHLSLIGILVALVIGWIFYTQRGLVGHEMSHLLDLPVSSKDAGSPDDRNDAQKQASTLAARETREADPASPPTTPSANSAASSANTGATANAAPGATPPSEAGGTSDPSVSPSAAGTAGAPAANSGGSAEKKTKIEVSFYEIPREALTQALAAGGHERAGEGNGGRAFYFSQGAKIAETLSGQGQALGETKSAGVNTGAQIITETPQAGSEAFQFLFQLDVTKQEATTLSVRWENNLILPQGSEPATGPPQLAESGLSGTTAFAPSGALVLVIEPSNRAPNEQYYGKSGQGPWTIFLSQEFRGGLTEWVALVQLK